MATSASTVDDEDFTRAHSKSVDFDSLFEAGGELAHHGDAQIVAQAESAFGGGGANSDDDDLMWPEEMFVMGVGADDAGLADSSTSSTEHTTTSTSSSHDWPDEMLV